MFRDPYTPQSVASLPFQKPEGEDGLKDRRSRRERLVTDDSTGQARGQSDTSVGHIR